MYVNMHIYFHIYIYIYIYIYSEDSKFLIWHLIQCNNYNYNNNGNDNNNNNNNNSFAFWIFWIQFCYFFGFICLFKRRMPTKACINYFSIKR